MGYTQDQYDIHAAAKHKWDNKANKAHSLHKYDEEYKYRGNALDARSHADSLYMKIHPNVYHDSGHMQAKQIYRSEMKEANRLRKGNTSFFK